MNDQYDPDSYFHTADRPSKGRKEQDEAPILPDKRPPRAFTSLADVNMNSELAQQIAMATSFRDHLYENSDAFQANHVTDSIKTCNVLIAQAVKLQEQVQNMQRMKAFEDAVIETMKTQSEEVKTMFFTLLKEALK